ncbi:hypothetical protein [Castellaniella denitrificans]|jgi:hypothetical protein|uniref:Uncharacterized protein n=1 Tax=Castellaniella denitrificans TaxID=56119 RepID=A0ABT4M7B3_9BURK|nr:hypothetical protein [Castellaniella denitrificans]MCZ4331216.1 hypothetical protein [Castellaniella denitrificans]
MIKNLLAIIGLAVVIRKSYEFYQHYDAMREENAYWRRKEGSDPATSPD